MSDLRDWLRGNKFEQYADAFEANDIDLDVLPELTEDDLGKLGISLGNRRRLLKALAERASGDVEAAPKPASESSGEGERRQVTVMFSDLVGSTALSARMDPEDLREVISAYQKCVADTVRRFGGFVAKYMGDGVLVYFGYPQAHEDDAERAVRAGLELIDWCAPIRASSRRPGPELVTFEIVPSPVIETNGPFFIGTGDGSAGYYAKATPPDRMVLRILLSVV